MKRLFPAPLLSANLFGLWLVLNQSVSAGHVLLAALLGVLIPRLTAPLRPLPVRIRRPRVLARLILRVGKDVLVSGAEVAWGLMRLPWRTPNGAFVRIPLDVSDPNALAALAVITTVVPGTVWSELAPDRSVLLLHVFDVRDETRFIAHYKSSYERPLKEIFQ